MISLILSKVKSIHMCGKFGDKLTIYGHWLYDSSKVYQSINRL